MKTEYPLLSELAILALLPFDSTYMCEKSFLTLTYVKTKYRSNLKDLELVLRPAITEIEPRFDFCGEYASTSVSLKVLSKFIVFCRIFSVLLNFTLF